MFIFGHSGIGASLLSRWIAPKGSLPLAGVLLGTLLSDLIDKPLYYGLSIATGLKGSALAELTGIGGTRTVAHTALFLVMLAFAALATRRRAFGRWILALALGVATHLVLDELSGLFDARKEGLPSQTSPLFWPFHGKGFPVYPFENAREHLGSVSRTHLWMGEILGAILLIRILLAAPRPAGSPSGPRA